MLKKHIQRHYDGRWVESEFVCCFESTETSDLKIIHSVLTTFTAYYFRYITCSIPNCNKGFTTKHQLTKHLKIVHSNKDSPIAPPRRIAVKRELGGKHNCYFESCDAHFETSELLNEHLTATHGLSIVKNAGKRTKMDVMFSEQLKSQKMDIEKQNLSAVQEEN